MKELIRLNSYLEAQDLVLFLGSEDIRAMIPDQHMLAIQGFANLAQGAGRVLVAEEDYSRALEMLKEWRMHFISTDSNSAQRVLEHPFAAGVSPRQVGEGFANWSKLRALGKVRVIGGVIVLPVVLFMVGWMLLAFYQFVTEQLI